MSQTMKEGTAQEVAASTFEKVALVDRNGQPKDTGTLSAYPDRLEFDGKAFQVTIPNSGRHVQGGYPDRGHPRDRGGAVDDPLHGAGGGAPPEVQRLREEFYEALKGVYGETHLTGTDQERMTAVEETVREAKLRSARRSIWIGVALFVGGLMLTIITYGMASDSGGGTYLIAYGPMLVGVVTLITGLVGAAKYRKTAA